MNTGNVETIAFCERCGTRCRAGVGNPDAKMLRRSKEPKGLCVNCATHDWLRNTYPCNMLLAESGPKVLVHPHIREQFAEIMRVGCADAKPDEINWNLINENWEMPFPHKIKPSSTNPCSQKELDEIKDRKRQGLGSPPKPDPLGGKMVIETLEELNLLENGLGDKLKSALTNSKEKIMLNSMQQEIEKAEKGEQMALIDVGPENLEAIVKEVRIYKKHQADRLAALKKEVKQKDKIKALVKEAELQRLRDGTIKFEADNSIVCLAPQDELITIKEKAPKKLKKSKKAPRSK